MPSSRCAQEKKKSRFKNKNFVVVCVPRRPYGYYGDLLLTGVNAYGFITLVNSSSITVNDSLDCSHGLVMRFGAKQATSPAIPGKKSRMIAGIDDIAHALTLKK